MTRVRDIHRFLLCLGALLLVALTPAFAADVSPVKVWEEETAIPTYLAADPEPNPLFFFGRSSQGAQAPVYPYPMYDTLTAKKADKTYTLVYLENDYIRIGVLPEIGGRIFEGLDKTNNYHFFYRQHVIKPALIGLLGAWISGGVEWNIPHHHRASTFIPVQHSVEENPDGSKTVWVGELEVRHRMRWAVGYTLRPGKAYLEASLRIVNRTPVANTMLCFANVAVHANDDDQILFPPSTQYATGHAKRTFRTWPIAGRTPEASESGKGVDISWYKNHKLPASVFAWNYEDDFFAGYDHGREAGTMSIADHNIVPGKKFFTWGVGPFGKKWDHILSDEDGSYLELMVGAYSDNQPDYSWLQPYEARSFSMYWYPFRDIGGVKEANLDAAVNLEVNDGAAELGFYVTSPYSAAKVMLKAGQRVLHEESIAIDPGKPYTKQVSIPAGIDKHDLVASISASGKELVSYSPIRLTPKPAPEGVKRPSAPKDVKTNEELYLIGLRAQQFHSPSVDPTPYWEEALRRDPGDARVNTVLGVTAYRKARYEEAEKLLRKALERLTDKYTSPKNGEAVYYLGLTLKAQRKYDEAFETLHKATWNFAWRAAGYYEMAEIATWRGDMAEAMDLVDRSIRVNALNIRAQNLKAALLRHAGRSEEALRVLTTAAYEADPLDVRSMAERWLASKDPEAANTLASTMNADPATAQETAAEFLNAGLWRDGTEALLQMTSAAPDKSRIHPMVYYYLGYFADQLGQEQQASQYYKLAMSMPVDYVFPFQSEAIVVLRQAIKANPRDARAPYYLGNLLYDWQPEEAAELWKLSASLDPSFAIVHRNLATAYMHQKSGSDFEKAIAALEKAVSLDRKYAKHFTELDELYEQTGASIATRLRLFEENRAVAARRDDSLNRAIALKVAAGKYDEAIEMMTGRQFAIIEGVNLNVGEHWANAHVLRGRRNMAANRRKEALADFLGAADIPSNIPSGFGFGDYGGASEIAYWTAAAYDAAGDREKAEQYWKKGAAARASGGMFRPPDYDPLSQSPHSYYRALCLQKLGKAGEAEKIYRNLVSSGQEALQERASTAGSTPQGAPRTRLATAHFVTGLGYLGLDDTAEAKRELTEALRLRPDLVGAKSILDEM